MKTFCFKEPKSTLPWFLSNYAFWLSCIRIKRCILTPLWVTNKEPLSYEYNLKIMSHETCHDTAPSADLLTYCSWAFFSAALNKKLLNAKIINLIRESKTKFGIIFSVFLPVLFVWTFVSKLSSFWRCKTLGTIFLDIKMPLTLFLSRSRWPKPLIHFISNILKIFHLQNGGG